MKAARKHSSHSPRELPEASAQEQSPDLGGGSKISVPPGEENSGVNLFKLDKVCKDGDVIVVPAKILAIGS